METTRNIHNQLKAWSKFLVDTEAYTNDGKPKNKDNLQKIQEGIQTAKQHIHQLLAAHPLQLMVDRYTQESTHLQEIEPHQ